MVGQRGGILVIFFWFFLRCLLGARFEMLRNIQCIVKSLHVIIHILLFICLFILVYTGFILFLIWHDLGVHICFFLLSFVASMFFINVGSFS